MDAGLMLYAALVLGAAVVLICRAGMMTPETDPAVRWQHLLLLAGLLFGLALALDGHPNAANACNVAGVLMWLLLSSARWRHGPPAGTVRTQQGAAD